MKAFSLFINFFLTFLTYNRRAFYHKGLKMRKLLFSAVVAATLLNAGIYEVDPSSQVGFEIKHLKLTKVEGSFKQFSGTVDYENGALNALDGSVEISSVDTGIQKRDDHLKANDIFDQAKFPQMSFKMTSFANGKMNGDLSIKGVSKPVVFDASIQENGKDLTIIATGTIKRSDFGVVWESNLQDSMVGDELTIKLNLLAKSK